jgi:hypothetical protein
MKSVPCKAEGLPPGGTLHAIQSLVIYMKYVYLYIKTIKILKRKNMNLRRKKEGEKLKVKTHKKNRILER